MYLRRPAIAKIVDDATHYSADDLRHHIENNPVSAGLVSDPAEFR
jgi:hypothetical protein